MRIFLAATMTQVQPWSREREGAYAIPNAFCFWKEGLGGEDVLVITIWGLYDVMSHDQLLKAARDNIDGLVARDPDAAGRGSRRGVLDKWESFHLEIDTPVELRQPIADALGLECG